MESPEQGEQEEERSQIQICLVIGCEKALITKMINK